MPSASTALCRQCGTQPSKYTCPSCKARTCSLACTKAHKSADTAADGVLCSAATTTDANTPSSSTAGPSTLPPSTASSTKPNPQFVPLTQYTESHMMQDFLFLSSISRTASETGRRIMSMNLLPPPTGPSDHTSKHPSNTIRLTNQQRQREQLLKQLHYRRFRVMVLPDGMARRKLNQSHFMPKEKKFGLTVEVKLPQTEAKESWMLHKQDSERTVEDVLLGELQHRSFANKKELTRLKGQLPSTSRRSKAWIIAAAIIGEASLPLPRTTTQLLKDDNDDSVRVVLHSFPKEWAILVPAYSARLTNESTTRYLDWWTRKRKWEEANPELAERQREEAREGARDWNSKASQPVDVVDQGWVRKRARGWQNGNEGARRDSGWQRRGHETAQPTPADGADAAPTDANSASSSTAPSAPLTESAVPQGIISNSLLSMLSQRLGRNPQPDPTPPSTASPADAPSTDLRPPSPPASTEESTAKSILTHITHPSHTTLSWLLQTLPEGYSVVEFPELRVIPVEQLGGLEVVPLAGEGVTEADVSEDHKEDAKGKRGAAEVSTVTVVPTAGALGSLGGLLAGYDSDSDEEEEEVEHAEVPLTVDPAESPDVPKASEEPATAGGSLASLAQHFGFHAPSLAS